MTLGSQLAVAISETALPADQCRACQRQGLPILPLRRALVPSALNEQTQPDLQTNTQAGLRTLRAGYLYVLLDRTIWQAYQVTPDGYLRQFNPYTPPAANETPLSETCVSANHDAPASFLNIDTLEHSTAWLAFASDPWPTSVLDAYKRTEPSALRFHKLDLASARNAPSSVGLAMTVDNLQVDQQVYEYQQHPSDSFNSVHGFYSRATRLTALQGFLRNTIPRHELQQGVLAIVLDDTIGLAQEHNAQRAAWVQTRQAWMEEPNRAYQQQTSQILLAIRAMHPEWAQVQTGSFAPFTGDGPPVFTDPEIERQRVVEKKARDFDRDLEQRYHEPIRAQFQKEYEQQLERYQGYIDQCAQAYAAICRSAHFCYIEQNDYDGNHDASGQAYSLTMALCLQGGITEAPLTLDENHQDQAQSKETGPTALLWRDWLSNPHSPIYRALLLRDKHLLAGLLPSFSVTGDHDWNDSALLYSALNKVLTSDESKRYLRPQLKEAMAQLLGSLNAASARLQPALGSGIERVVSRLNSASQLLYNGVHLIELKVQMKLSEYYVLQSEHLRKQQLKAAQTIDRQWRAAKNTLDTADQHARLAGKKVRPLIQSGLLSLAVLDPKLAAQTITLTVWVEAKATELRENLMRDANRGLDQLGKSAHAALIDVAVGIGTLDPQARKALQGIKVTSQQAAKWVRGGFAGLHGAVGNSAMLLAVGGLYLLGDSLKKNIKAAEEAIGDKSLEARLALYGTSLGLLGGGVELVGIALEGGAKRVQKVGGLSPQGVSAASKAATAGQILARAGATIAAVVGFYDATRAGVATKRARNGGDKPAALAYSVATVLSSVGAVLSVWAAASVTSTLLGPLGIAILLGLTGYGFYKWAEGEESTPLERWARRCYFGVANETFKIHWDTPDQAHTALAELNAATSGIEAAVSFRERMAGMNSPHFGGPLGSVGTRVVEQLLEYRIVLPLYDENRSAYRWSLTVHRHADGTPGYYTGGEVIAEGDLNPPSIPTPASERRATSAAPTLPKKPDYRADTTTPQTHTRTAKLMNGRAIHAKEIRGTIVLLPDTRRHNIEGATLSLTYWPDRDVSDGYAEVILMDFS